MGANAIASTSTSTTHSGRFVRSTKIGRCQGALATVVSIIIKLSLVLFAVRVVAWRRLRGALTRSHLSARGLSTASCTISLRKRPHMYELRCKRVKSIAKLECFPDAAWRVGSQAFGELLSYEVGVALNLSAIHPPVRPLHIDVEHLLNAQDIDDTCIMIVGSQAHRRAYIFGVEIEYVDGVRDFGQLDDTAKRWVDDWRTFVDHRGRAIPRDSVEALAQVQSTIIQSFLLANSDLRPKNLFHNGQRVLVLDQGYLYGNRPVCSSVIDLLRCPPVLRPFMGGKCITCMYSRSEVGNIARRVPDLLETLKASPSIRAYVRHYKAWEYAQLVRSGFRAFRRSAFNCSHTIIGMSTDETLDFVLEGIVQRTRMFLREVEACVKRRGEQGVLVFP